MTDADERAIQRDELRDLVEVWRDAADYAHENGIIREADSIRGCADELEDVLDDD